MSRRSFFASVLLVLTIAGILRGVAPTSDPPVTNGVGVVWHDEGAWVHNARNRALWGVWRTDNWNPMFIAPVFTALEYGAFRLFGVGTWQARVVPAASGLIAIVFVIAGLSRVAGRRAAVLGGTLLAVNYAFVMWNRAALMESSMTAFIVVSWAAYALAEHEPRWGLLAGVAAILAFFTKGSAAFFAGALVLDVLVSVIARRPLTVRAMRRALWTAAGLVIAAAIVGAAFVIPHWTEFRFYNWQMTVTRKPEYTVRALMTRASWLPLVHDFFSWMWPLFVAACLAIVRIGVGWRTAAPARRLLALWVVVGLIELVVHDSGNERRYVMFIPALVALAADWLASESPDSIAVAPSRDRILAAVIALPLGYLAAGSLVRLLFLEDVRSGHLHTTVVLSMGLATAAAVAAFAFPRLWQTRGTASPWRRYAVAAALMVTVGVDARHFVAWARDRQSLNYEASLDVGRWLPSGTLVQGKLANGLSLENRIRPIFIGHGFGNYADRLARDDVRYILTYVSPSVGFESQAGSGLIEEILDRYPQHRTVAVFPVDETAGPDRAALIDKFPGTVTRARD